MAKKSRGRAERRRAARAEASRADDRSVAPAPRAATSSPQVAAKAARKSKPKTKAKRRRGLPLATIGWSIGGLAAVGLLILALTASGTAQPADAATEQLARANAGTDVTVHSGSAHVVYHSDEPLPSRAAPRADGQPTLVWFSGTWCHVCEQMAPFAHETASAYTDQLVFIEKSVDHDRQASNRYGVRGTPTFIMLDAAGSEVVRFHGSPNAASFASAIERAIDAIS